MEGRVVREGPSDSSRCTPKDEEVGNTTEYRKRGRQGRWSVHILGPDVRLLGRVLSLMRRGSSERAGEVSRSVIL